MVSSPLSEPSVSSLGSERRQEKETEVNDRPAWTAVKKPSVSVTGRRGAIWEDAEASRLLEQQATERKRWMQRNPVAFTASNSAKGVTKVRGPWSVLLAKTLKRPRPDVNAALVQLKEYGGETTIREALKREPTEQAVQDAINLEESLRQLIQVEDNLERCENAFKELHAKPVKENVEELDCERKLREWFLSAVVAAKFSPAQALACIKLIKEDHLLVDKVGCDRVMKFIDLCSQAEKKQRQDGGVEQLGLDQLQCLHYLIKCSRLANGGTLNQRAVLVKGALTNDLSKRWMRHQSKQGRSFYYCEETGEKTWERPFSLDVQELKHAQRNRQLALDKIRARIHQLSKTKEELQGRFQRRQVLSLEMMGLKRLPKSITSLRGVKAILLGNNMFPCSPLQGLEHGAFAKGLVSLHLESCKLGKLGSEIGEFTNLRVLNLRQNEKLSSLPEEICELQQLAVFVAEQCGLNQLPSSLLTKPWKNLEVVKLSRNRLNSFSELVPSLQSSPRLDTLELSSNLLKGSLDLTVLPKKVTRVLVDHNALESLRVGPCISLKVLHAENNKLCEFKLCSALPALESLQLQHNQLGSLDLFKELESMRGLKMLNLSVNALCKLGNGGRAHSNLKQLYLGRNHLQKLPDKFFELLTGLETCELYGNQLSAIPNVGGLKQLKLQENLFEQMPKVERVQEVNIARNKLESLEDVVGLIRKGHGSLQVLVLKGNPVTNHVPNVQKLRALGKVEKLKLNL